MKNREILNLLAMVGNPAIIRTNEIKSTKFQWWKNRNIEKLQCEAKKIYAALEELKSDELKEASKDVKSDDFKRLATLFENQPEVVELLEIENDIELKKVKLSDLPGDLNQDYIFAIDWMIEE